MFGTILYVPLFVQGVIGTSATSSGVVLTPFILADCPRRSSPGQWIIWGGATSRTPWSARSSSVSVSSCSPRWIPHRDRAITVCAVIAGIGQGLMMQAFVVGVQNSVPVDSMGSATALTQFLALDRTTFGVTLMGVIVGQGLPPGVRVESETVQRLSPASVPSSRTRSGLPHSWRPRWSAWCSSRSSSSASTKCRSRRGFDRAVTPAPMEPESQAGVRMRT